MERLSVSSFKRSRWAAIGAAVAVTIGSGGLMSASADVGTGDRPVFVAITPCRLADSRPGSDNVGPRSTPLGAAETYTMTVHGTNGNCTIPADAKGIAVNVAAIFPTAASFFTLFPADAASRPLSANLNFVGGQQPVSNSASVRLSVDGKVSIFNLAGTVHFTLDISGYYVGHNHNDVYYTKTETDTLLAAKANNPVTSAQILDGTIAPADLADNAVTTPKLAADAVTTPKLAADAVTSAKILNATVALADLAPNSVDASKVVDGSLGTDDVGQLHGDNDIIDNTITTFDIATNAIDSDEVLDFGLSNQDVGVLFAQVNANGTTTSTDNSGGVTVVKIGVGTYEVDFGRDISDCGFVATQGEAGIGAAGGAIMGVTDRGGNAEAVFVTARDSAGALADRAFQLVVVC